MNKVNVFRVDNPIARVFVAEIGIGPYNFFSQLAHPNTAKQWAFHCGKHEPGEGIYKKHGINNRKLNAVPTLPSERRPGPFEDIGLRQPFIENIGRTKVVEGKHVVYCFDSIEQYHRWFHDPLELQFMAEHGFVLSQYVVDAKHFLRGHSQCAFLSDGFKYVKARYTLTTLNPITPIYTPPKPMPKKTMESLQAAINKELL